MNTSIKISNLLKGLLLIVISTFVFACSKSEGPTPMSSSNADNISSSSVVLDNESLPKSLEKTSDVVGGDDKEDDDDNRGGGFPKRK